QQKEELIAKNEAVYKSQQALADADLNYMQLKEKQLHEQIEFKNKQIATHALNIIQKNESLRKLKGHLESMVKHNGRIALTDIRRTRSEEHTSELQSRENLVCRLLLEKKK